MIDHGALTHLAVEIGGVIIAVDGERAVMHHGGYWALEPERHFVVDPIEVPWRVINGNMIFDLRGWSCRIMQVIESAKMRYVSILATPIWTTNGEFILDWSTPATPMKADTVEVIYAS